MDDLKQINLSPQEPLIEDNIMQPLKKSNFMPIIVILAIFLGLGTGFYLAQKHLLLASDKAPMVAGAQSLTSTTNVKVGDVFGSADEKTFRDQAEGVLMTGGIDGEGSHHIERGANKTQWVYITSSVVDLDLLVGDRVTIWGETNQGKKAGWLMDVGKLKVQELNVAKAQDENGNQE
jgi:hypothetical protein